MSNNIINNLDYMEPYIGDNIVNLINDINKKTIIIINNNEWHLLNNPYVKKYIFSETIIKYDNDYYIFNSNIWNHIKFCNCFNH